MKTFTIKTKGLDSVLRNAEKIAKDKAHGIDTELDTAAINIHSDARGRPKGNLASQIYSDTSKRFSKSVGVGNPIGAYIEFGTGQHVFKGPYSFTPEEKQFAKQFYVSGKGKTPSHPYMFPSFHEEIPKLLQRI